MCLEQLYNKRMVDRLQYLFLGPYLLLQVVLANCFFLNWLEGIKNIFFKVFGEWDYPETPSTKHRDWLQVVNFCSLLWEYNSVLNVFNHPLLSHIEEIIFWKDPTTCHFRGHSHSLSCFLLKQSFFSKEVEFLQSSRRVPFGSLRSSLLYYIKLLSTFTFSYNVFPFLELLDSQLAYYLVYIFVAQLLKHWHCLESE